jgi:S1-C subfamily serine protease
MSKIAPHDSAKRTLRERVAALEWQYWIARLVPMLYITTLTLILPKILTQSFVVSELGITPEQKIHQHLSAISIKVIAHGESVGSGVLLKRHHQVYTVITNAHVVQASSAPYQLQTHDGQVYAAALIAPPSGHNRDLSILRFQSHQRSYPTAKLATTAPKVGDRVWSAGFPTGGNDTVDRHLNDLNKAPWGLDTVDGQITHILPVAVAGGYGIGFDAGIRKGMSGGPLVDRAGELIGLNGVHANPLWDTPEILENGSTASNELKEQIHNSSWAIPIEYVLDYTRL